MAHKRMEKLKDLMNMETVHVAMDFWKEHGLRPCGQVKAQAAGN